MENPSSTTIDVDAALDEVGFLGEYTFLGPILDDNVTLSHDEEAEGTGNIIATNIDEPQSAQHANTCMALEVEVLDGNSSFWFDHWDDKEVFHSHYALASD
ncbi:hypothetical protein ACH5RR_040940 [Cinchona calisaya]|uniref:Uncharacterized protein n=1 Tax=Cinchona calisaya TaxID=153742 RepID=A0ABD2XT78_9GENT